MQQAHVGQAVSVVDAAASLQDLCGDRSGCQELEEELVMGCKEQLRDADTMNDKPGWTSHNCARL